MPAHSTSEVWAEDDLLELTRAGTEVWRPVPGTDGWYDVSNLGRVRSWIGPRFRRAGRASEPNVLVACHNRKPGPTRKKRYLCVTVFVGERRRYVPVHNLVCEAFIGPRPDETWEAGHHDDNEANNRLDNLKWCTTAANWADRKKNRPDDRLLRESRDINGGKHWQCTACQQWKPETEFGRIRGKNAERTRCGVLPECRRCSSARRLESRRKAKGATP